MLTSAKVIKLKLRSWQIGKTVTETVMVKIFMDNRTSIARDIFGSKEVKLKHGTKIMFNLHTCKPPQGPSREVTKEYVLSKFSELEHYNGEDFAIETVYAHMGYGPCSKFKKETLLDHPSCLAIFNAFNPDIIITYWEPYEYNYIKTRDDQILISFTYIAATKIQYFNDDEITEYEATGYNSNFQIKETEVIRLELAKALNKYFARKTCNVKSAKFDQI